MVLGATCRKSKELNASQHADNGLFRDKDRRPEAIRWWTVRFFAGPSWTALFLL